MIIGSAAASTAVTSKRQYSTGDIIWFGSYPQSKVTDTALISVLNSQSLKRVSYGCYSGNGNFGTMISGGFMNYADVSLERY